MNKIKKLLYNIVSNRSMHWMFKKRRKIKYSRMDVRRTS